MAMSPRKTRTVPVGAMIAALAVIAIAAIFALIVGGDIFMESSHNESHNEQPTVPTDENQ